MTYSFNAYGPHSEITCEKADSSLPQHSLHARFFYSRAVELGITAEDLIVAEEQEEVSSPRRLPVMDSDSDVTKALVICHCKLSITKNSKGC